MTKLKTLLATAAVATAMMATAAHATVLVFDDFEGYGNQNIENFTGFTNLHVEDGTVDLIGTPNPWLLQTGYNSGFVDLDGSTNDGGLLRTNVFTVHAGDVVTLDFDLSGNQRSGTDMWDFGFQTAGGSIDFNNIMISGYHDTGPANLSSSPGVAIGVGTNALDYTAGWSHYSLSFTAGNSGSFTAYVATTSADNIGPLVDNFRVTSTGAVPEPASWALMIAGFGGVGAALRRRRVAAATA